MFFRENENKRKNFFHLTDSLNIHNDIYDFSFESINSFLLF